MKKFPKYILTLMVFFLCFQVGSHHVFAQNASSFEAGNKLYAAKNYDAAITNWNKIIKSGSHSPEVYYNMANAYYELNKIGPSIYYYEKALQLAPNDKDVLTNLSFAQNARVDAIEKLPQHFFAAQYERLYSLATFETWALVNVVFTALTVLLFLLYYFANSAGKKRLFLGGSTFSFVLLLLSISLAYATYNNAKMKNPAIIFDTEVAVKEAATLGSETKFMLHEGTKVEVTSNESDWVEIKVENGTTGWILKNALKKL